MRDKGLVFDELRRQRRNWSPASRDASMAWLLGLLALLVLTCVLQAERFANRSEARGVRATWTIAHDRSPDGQPEGGRYGAEPK